MFNRDEQWENRGHFFAAAAEAMRRILIENARRKKRQKRGGEYQRVPLEDVDVGFAFLPQYWSQGYAYESTCAVMEFARSGLGLKRILGITANDNVSSIKLLEKIGLRFEKMIQLTEDEPEIKLFVSEA